MYLSKSAMYVPGSYCVSNTECCVGSAEVASLCFVAVASPALRSCLMTSMSASAWFDKEKKKVDLIEQTWESSKCFNAIIYAGGEGWRGEEERRGERRRGEERERRVKEVHVSRNTNQF